MSGHGISSNNQYQEVEIEKDVGCVTIEITIAIDVRKNGKNEQEKTNGSRMVNG